MKKDRTVVKLGGALGAEVGGEEGVCIIAGPCSVERPESAFDLCAGRERSRRDGIAWRGVQTAHFAV